MATNTRPVKSLKKGLPVKLAEPLLLDARFYQLQYVRSLRIIVFMLFVNILVMLGVYHLLKKHVPADVYAITITGKLIKLNEIQNPGP